MSIPATDSETLVVSNYRFDFGFIFGYAILFAGLLLFDWDPRYVFLGVVVELVIVILFSNVKAFITAPRTGAPWLAVVLNFPPLLVALILSGISLNKILEAENTGGGEWLWLGIIGFFAGTIYSQICRFLHNSLPLAKFYKYLNQKYQFDDGRPVFNGCSIVSGPFIESWIATLVFVSSLFLASLVGAIESGDGNLLSFTRAGAVVLTVLCLLRQIAVILIIRAIYQNRPCVEDLWVKSLEKTGNLVLRDSTKQ